MNEAWEMYASAGPAGSDEPMRHFGPLGFARMDQTADRVIEVRVEVVDEPQAGDYWAWYDHGTTHPCHIAATEQAMTSGFLLNQTDAPGPREEQEVGLGRIVRLRITEVREVALRSRTRRSWKVVSAL